MIYYQLKDKQKCYDYLDHSVNFMKVIVSKY
jgi:hypothetical protein